MRCDRRGRDAGVRRFVERCRFAAACPRDRHERERQHDRGFESDSADRGAGPATGQHQPTVDRGHRTSGLDPYRIERAVDEQPDFIRISVDALSPVRW